MARIKQIQLESYAVEYNIENILPIRRVCNTVCIFEKKVFRRLRTKKKVGPRFLRLCATSLIMHLKRFDLSILHQWNLRTKRIIPLRVSKM